MPGLLNYDFRQGHRSEYLANYILSSLGIVVKVPIEEDIGTDFYCSIAKKEDRKLTFQAPFMVQAKSISLGNITYGGPNKKGNWKEYECAKQS